MCMLAAMTVSPLVGLFYSTPSLFGAPQWGNPNEILEFHKKSFGNCLFSYSSVCKWLVLFGRLFIQEGQHLLTEQRAANFRRDLGVTYGRTLIDS